MSSTEADKYEVLERIGQGSFGVIRKVRRKADGLVLCRKEICYGKMSEKERHQLQAELNILKQLDHPNIVRYFEKEHHRDSHDLHLYMEYCGNGDLGIMIKDLKARGTYADEEVVWTIFAQLISALYRCHYGEDPPGPNVNAVGLAKTAAPLRSKQNCERMILHRDLKPENVFLGNGNAVKLGDFGLSKIIASHDFTSTYVGTPFYMSPEICAAERYSLHSDIWSLGCVMYELCAQNPPFNAKTHFDLIQKIKIGKIAPLPAMYSRDLGNLIASCLQVNPNSRPDTASLLNLPRVKLIRKSQESALIIQQHVLAKDLAIEQLRIANQRIAALEASQEAKYAEMDKKLHLEWETRASLEINRLVDIAQKKYEAMLEQRVQEELARRIATLPSSQGTSFSSAFEGSHDAEEPIPRSSTPTALPSARASLGTLSEQDEEFQSGADLTGLSLEDSPLEKKQQKPLKKSGRTPFTRARTIANAEEYAPSPMDVQMADPSPIRNIAGLSLSPRRNTPLEGSSLRQPAFRGANIFDKAAMKENTKIFEADAASDDEDDTFDDEASPIRPRVVQITSDPFKVPTRPSGLARPGLTRARTTQVPQLHQRMKSTPNVFGPTPVSKPSPSILTNAENTRPTSPLRRPASRGALVSPARKAPSAPAQPSPTALNAKKALLSNAAASNPDLGRQMHRNKIQGRTLVELNMAEVQNQQPSSVNGSGMQQMDVLEQAKGLKMVPVWDPERDEMPSPFLVRTRKVMAAR